MYAKQYSNYTKQNEMRIKVSFCPQKRMSPPVPQTVVKGKKGHNSHKIQEIKISW